MEQPSSILQGLTPTPAISLTEEQLLAATKVYEWLDPLNQSVDRDKKHSKQTFKLGGYAGTGKTTLMKHLVKEMRTQGLSVAICAFTGKAVSVLHRKGVPEATTMHVLMYDVNIDDKGAVTFSKKSFIPGNPNMVVVDEASMVNKDLLEDLLSYNTKILFVGDPGQLPPVGDNPNVMAACDFTLTTIHRQAEKSPIITFATQIRTTGLMPPRGTKFDGLEIRDKNISAEMFLAADQVICAKNATRKKLNEKFRLQYNYTQHEIVEKEKLIVLKNNRQFGVYNGMHLFVDKVHNSSNNFCWVLDCHDDIDRKFTNIKVWRKPFQEDLAEGEYAPRDVVHCDYGYCVTCHKAQGSEWDSVLVLDEWMPPKIWDMKRWRYTAITRASKNLVFCV